MSEAQALVLAEEDGAIVDLIPAEDLRTHLRKYRAHQSVLDTELSDGQVEIAGKMHRTRSYWRATAFAGHIKVRKVGERREVFGLFHDGRENFAWIVDYIAIAPNGREAPGDGMCEAIEKAESFKCPHLVEGSDWKTVHYRNLELCPAFDPEFEWHRRPAEATEHNVRATANTRAHNRAISNLIGFGEVSAEEVDRPSRREASPAAKTPPRPISEPQRKRMWAIATRAGWQEHEVKGFLAKRGIDHTGEIPTDQYEAICKALEQGMEGAR